MNIQRLRYLREIARQNLNLTAAANVLHTSQPGVSRQILELEDELGLKIFVRKGRRLVAITEPGQRVLRITERLLAELENLDKVAQEHEDEATGNLVIATTHTQARYRLPDVLVRFRAQFPKVNIQLKQGTPDQIVGWLAEGQADVGTASEALQRSALLAAAPWYTWSHCVVVPTGHELARRYGVSSKPSKPSVASVGQGHTQLISLKEIAQYPLLTYDTAFAGRNAINHAFNEQGLSPQVAISALDADVIKTYVRGGLGVGLIAQMAFEPSQDPGLQAIDASHLFAPRVAYLAIAKQRIQRSFTYGLLDLCVDKGVVKQLKAQATQA
jgi:LysR family transcriptional regulator, cys regulon transcriptional activator